MKLKKNKMMKNEIKKNQENNKIQKKQLKE
jgi:hypothetical protein